MPGCACGTGAGGPMSTGKELVEFVYHAHGGSVRNRRIGPEGLRTVCQGCRQPFTLETYVGSCPCCGGVHAVAPMRPTAEHIQFAGNNYRLPRSL